MTIFCINIPVLRTILIFSSFINSSKIKKGITSWQSCVKEDNYSRKLLKILISVRKMPQLLCSSCCQLLITVTSTRLYIGKDRSQQLNLHFRDLKPENLLLDTKDDDSSIKVIDFGTSRQFEVSKKMR